MSGVPLETCWAFNERWNNKFYYKVASCWLFLLSHTTMHGSMNMKYSHNLLFDAMFKILTRVLMQVQSFGYILYILYILCILFIQYILYILCILYIQYILFIPTNKQSVLCQKARTLIPFYFDFIGIRRIFCQSRTLMSRKTIASINLYPANVEKSVSS
jgi:hypothetical protein